MLDRISVNALLKSVIATLAMAVMVMLVLGAWDSWRRLGSVDRIAAVTDASTHLFAALHNLRVDRAQTFRALNGEQPAPLSPSNRAAREAEMPALRAALATLKGMEFPEQPAVVSGLQTRINKLAALHQESITALAQPKTARRPGLAQEFFTETGGLLEFLDKLSPQLTRLVKLEDAFIDQVLELKQHAWIVRNAAGDASLAVSNFLAGQPTPPDAMIRYTSHVSRIDTAWAALEDLAAGLPLPPRFAEAKEKAKRDFFARDFTEMRVNTLRKLMAGEKPGITQEQWSPLAVGKLASLLGVAETALEVAKEHAARQRAEALWRLVSNSHCWRWPWSWRPA
jgi:methyl-accepting chemotaxis protein